MRSWRWRHVLVGRRRQDGHGLEFAAVGAEPMFPKPCERKQRLAFQADQMRLLGARPAGPFIKAIGRNKAAAMANCAAKRRLFGHRLRSGIDQRCEFARIFDPRRYQPPAHQVQLARVLRVEHGR